MVKSAVGKVVWIGRATVFLVGLAVILALVFGLASAALGADGKSFLLGRTNLAKSVTTLVKSGVGPALALQVDSGPPLAVNSSNKVNRLNADTVDGKHATDFAEKQVEPWHEVGTAGEPALESDWSVRTHIRFGGDPSDYTLNSLGFYKDPLGVVHLKGWVSVQNPEVQNGSTVFTLPPGYRPAATEMLTDGGTSWYGIITPSGEVKSLGASNELIFDGVTFRAAN
jgi:hypothetical protein